MLNAGQGESAVLPALLQTRCEQLLHRLHEAANLAVATRVPLVRQTLSKVPEIKRYAPRFEEDFALGKDYDPDRYRPCKCALQIKAFHVRPGPIVRGILMRRERAEQKRLKRQLRKEQRGAMRELRKDSVFMSAVRDRDRAGRGAELDQSARKAMSFLQSQEADFKSGGQGGMWKKKKR